MKGFNWVTALLKKRLENKETFKLIINCKEGDVINAKHEPAAQTAPKETE